MAQQLDMFPDAPRRPKRVMLSVSDAGIGTNDLPLRVHLTCRKCGHDHGWRLFRIKTETLRQPCPVCLKAIPSKPGLQKKPLFVPLMAEQFEAFAAGCKTEEFRVYGPRWNERTCQRGRRVTLSCGYGTARRLHGTVTGLRIVGADAHPILPRLYPGRDKFAAIAIRLDDADWKCSSSGCPDLTAEGRSC